MNSEIFSSLDFHAQNECNKAKVRTGQLREGLRDEEGLQSIFATILPWSLSERQAMVMAPFIRMTSFLTVHLNMYDKVYNFGGVV